MVTLKDLEFLTAKHADMYSHLVGTLLHQLSDEEFLKIPIYEMWDIEINVFNKYGFVFSEEISGQYEKIYSVGSYFFRIKNKK